MVVLLREIETGHFVRRFQVGVGPALQQLVDRFRVAMPTGHHQRRHARLAVTRVRCDVIITIKKITRLQIKELIMCVLTFV